MPSPRLISGPYAAPVCAVGSELRDEADGIVIVSGFTGPMRWPWRLSGRSGRRLILCGDLARAVRFESVAAISSAWGVATRTVAAWRRSLGIDGLTLGARAPMGRHHSPRPSNGTPERAAAMLAARAGGWASRKVWTPAEDAMVGVMPDTKLASITRRTVRAVAVRRQAMGLPAIFDASARVSKGHATRWGVRYEIDPAKLAAAIRAAGLNRASVADRVDVAVSTLAKALRGIDTAWPRERIQSAARVLNCGDNDLLSAPDWQGPVEKK